MKDYLKDYLAGRRGEEIPRHSRGKEVPEVPKAIFGNRIESSVTFGTSQGIGYAENLEAQSAASPTNDPEINWRVEVMLEQIPNSGPLPFLIAREGVERQAGCCLSCGDLLNQGDAYRCGACSRAANLAIEMSLFSKSGTQHGERVD